MFEFNFLRNNSYSSFVKDNVSRNFMPTTIEYIKFLSKKETSQYIENRKSFYTGLKKKVNAEILKNEKRLIQEYEKFESDIIKKYENDLKEFKLKYSLWKTKKCKCGKKIIYISSYNFWGCTDYKSIEKEHITFREDEVQQKLFESYFKNIKVRLNKDWCTTILVNLNLKNKIQAKELFLFYQSLGLDDLREKYGYKNTLLTLSTYEFANKKSKKEERIVKGFLENHFNILYQPYIEYKFKNSSKKICIPDLIISDEDIVLIIEIKTHNMYIDEEQLALYHQLISYLQTTKKDNRNLASIFVVNEIYESEFNTNNGVLIEKLINLQSKEDIINYLLLNRYQ